MQIAAIKPKSLPSELVYRVQIGIFWLLCLLLGNTLLAPIADGVLYFTLTALIDLFTIQAMFGLFGDTPLVCDANELNCYAVIIHLVAIPLYLHGVPSDWHNFAINCLAVFYLIRLFYFGGRRADGEFSGWVKFGVLGWAHHFLKNYASTGDKKRVLFVVRVGITIATVVSLWVMTARTNDNRTLILTMLITTFVLVYGVWRNEAQFTGAREDTAAVDTAVVDAVAQKEESGDFSFTSAEKYLLMAIVTIVLVGALTLVSQKKTMFVLGYATGYKDGKTGADAKAESDLNKVVMCYFRGKESFTLPQPVSAECDEVFGRRINKDVK